MLGVSEGEVPGYRLQGQEIHHFVNPPHGLLTSSHRHPTWERWLTQKVSVPEARVITPRKCMSSMNLCHFRDLSTSQPLSSFLAAGPQ